VSTPAGCGDGTIVGSATNIIATGIADGIRYAMEPLHMVGTTAAYVGVIATLLVGAVVIAAACVVAYYGVRMLLKFVI